LLRSDMGRPCVRNRLAPERIA